MNGLDKIDMAILDMLQSNAHLTIKEIAAAVNISLTPVHERIKKLENEGIIDKYVTLLNKKKLGKSLIVFCNVKSPIVRRFSVFQRCHQFITRSC
jgi:Lrp/AsnC family transcriptional regulator, leucine-responsive regulatory protein